MARLVQQNATGVTVACKVFLGGDPANIPYNQAGISIQADIGNGRQTLITTTPVTLASGTAAHAEGGWIARGTGFGYHRFDLPNTCTAQLGPLNLTGKTTAGHVFVFEDVLIVPYDPNATPSTEIADTLLDRNLATGTDSGSNTVRTVRQALRALRNRFTVAGGTVTFYKEDDATVSHTAAVTGTPAVTEANPAGGS